MELLEIVSKAVITYQRKHNASLGRHKAGLRRICEKVALGLCKDIEILELFKAILPCLVHLLLFTLCIKHFWCNTYLQILIKVYNKCIRYMF